MTPALRKAFDDYRDERATELYEIAAKLEEHDFSPDAGPVRTAANQCRSAIRTARGDVPDAGRSYWGYEISDLRIRLDAQRHCRPRAATMEGARGWLTVRVEEYVPETAEQVGAGYPLLRRLDTDFYFDAELLAEGELHPLRSAWHLDTHLYADAESHTAHPRFHFQVGGERLDALDDAIRGVFMPETPRLPVAPLDGILAIDFVLSHYCGADWRVLGDLDGGYRYLRKALMRRYWQPYYRTLSEGIEALDLEPQGGSARSLVPSVFG